MKIIVWFFFFIMVINVILLFLISKVIVGGFIQFEVQSFFLIGIIDMVDFFLGDFYYNILLMDVEGYLINLIYNFGVSMEQEVSWVGFGWNLNMGVIVCNMRGLFDDFSGDVVIKEINLKLVQNFEIGFGVGVEFFGKELNFGVLFGSGIMGLVGFLSVFISINYNIYNGFGVSFNFGFLFFFVKKVGVVGIVGF